MCILHIVSIFSLTSESPRKTTGCLCVRLDVRYEPCLILEPKPTRKQILTYISEGFSDGSERDRENLWYFRSKSFDVSIPLSTTSFRILRGEEYSYSETDRTAFKTKLHGYDCLKACTPEILQSWYSVSQLD
jgi:hypothetical protein